MNVIVQCVAQTCRDRKGVTLRVMIEGRRRGKTRKGERAEGIYGCQKQGGIGEVGMVVDRVCRTFQVGRLQSIHCVRITCVCLP
jgi:hypothetical protein